MTDLLAGLPRAMRSVLAQEAARLLAALPDGRAKVAGEHLRPIMLSATGKDGTAKLRRGAYPLGTMLYERPSSTLPRVAERDWLRGWAMVGAMRFCNTFRETDHFSRITAGLRTARRMAQGRYRHDLMAELPLLEGDIDGLVDAIRKLVTSLEQRGIEYAPQLAQLELILRDAAAPVAPRHVDTLRRAAADDGMILPRRDLATGDMTIIMTGSTPVPADTSPEEQAEDLRPSLYDFGATFRALAPPVARAEAQLDLLDLAVRDSPWQAAFAALTPQEARTVFAAATRDARTHQPGAGLVLASLVSGRSVDDLATAGRRPVSGATWIGEHGAICFAPDVRFAGNPVAGGFALQPPPELVGWLTGSKEPGQAKRLAAEWLSRIDTGRTLRLSRIARALQDGLLAGGEDAALAGLLAGHSCAAQVQLYYARFPVERMRTAWLGLIADHFGPAAGFRLDPLHRRCRTIGSMVVPPRQNVTKWFATLTEAVEQARAARSSGIEHLVGRVAAEANLAAAVLSLQTARRPHREAFEPLSQITGRHRPRVRLQGKGGRQVDDGRWVPLGAPSQQAIALWMSLLDTLEASCLCGANPALWRMIQAIRAGEAPLFFRWDSLDVRPEPLSAAALFARIGAPVLAPDSARSPEARPVDNWVRHFMRNELAEEGVPGTLIDGFFGHGGAAGDPLAPASGAAAADLDLLRRAIDTIWDRLRVHIPPPLPPEQP